MTLAAGPSAEHHQRVWYMLVVPHYWLIYPEKSWE